MSRQTDDEYRKNNNSLKQLRMNQNHLMIYLILNDETFRNTIDPPLPHLPSPNSHKTLKSRLIHIIFIYSFPKTVHVLSTTGGFSGDIESRIAPGKWHSWFRGLDSTTGTTARNSIRREKKARERGDNRSRRR